MNIAAALTVPASTLLALAGSSCATSDLHRFWPPGPPAVIRTVDGPRTRVLVEGFDWNVLDVGSLRRTHPDSDVEGSSGQGSSPVELLSGLTIALKTCLEDSARFECVEPREAVPRNASVAQAAGAGSGIEQDVLLVRGRVTEWDEDADHQTVSGEHRGSKLQAEMIVGRCTIELRVLDSRSGRLLSKFTASGVARGLNVEGATQLELGSRCLPLELGLTEKQGMAAAVREAITRGVEEMSRVDWGGRAI